MAAEVGRQEVEAVWLWRRRGAAVGAAVVWRVGVSEFT